MGLFEKGLEKESVKAKSKVILGRTAEKARVETKQENSNYKTDIDRLLKLVQNSKSIEINKISDILDLKLEQVEEFARILENNKLIEIYYPPMGSAVLRIKDSNRKERDNKLLYSIISFILIVIIIGAIYLWRGL